MFKTKNSKLFFTTLLFVILAFVGNEIVNAFDSRKRSYYLEVQSNLLEAKYNTSYKYFKIMSRDIYDMYMHNKKLLTLLEKATTASEAKKDILRQQIYKILRKNYKRLTNMGISQVHFHLPDNTSFLRMFAPQKYGDSLASFRETVVLANKKQTRQEGFEAGKNILALRFVYPIIKNKKTIATIEIAYSTQQILRSITDDYIYDAHILILKDLSNLTVVNKEYGYNYRTTWETPAYYIEESTHTKKVVDKNFYIQINKAPLREAIIQGIATKKPFSVATLYNYKHIVLTFLPLFDVTKTNNIAYIVTYTQSDYLSNLDIEKSYLKILLSAVLILLYLFSIYVIINREKLKELALFDALTKLPNRTLFMIEFQNELNRAFRNKTKLALLFIDLDGFKGVNDTYGHQMGDALLQKVSEILLTSIRKSDIASRLSGDEFTIVLTEIDTVEEILKVANYILDEINQELLINHEIIRVGASIGIAIYPEHGTNLDTLIQHADTAMYIAKEQGKNQIHLYSNEDDDNV